MWRRWGMLAVYFGVCATNGMVWCTFAPISNEAVDYYSTTIDFINWFELCFFVCYFPPAPFAPWLIGKYLHWGMLLNTMMTFIGCWLRYLAGNNVILAFIGQMFIAIISSPVLSACSAITAQWFPAHEQSLANTLSSLSNFIGIGAQFLISPLVSDIPTILLIHACFSSFILFLSAFSIRRSPNPYAIQDLVRPLRSCIRNKPLIFIMLSTGAIMGVGFATLGILLVILAPSGYSPIYTGCIGIIMVTSSILGGYIATKLAENDRYIQPTIWTYTILSIISSILFAVFIENKVPSFILASLFGFSLIGFAPLGLRMSVNLAKNVEESISANVIFGSSSIFGLLMTYPLVYFDDGTGTTSLWCVAIYVVTSYSIFIFAFYINLARESKDIRHSI